MKKSIWANLATCVLLVLAVTPARAQQGGQPFSADTATTMPRTGEKTTGKIYFSPPKIRTDTSSKGHDSIMIIDSSTKTSYVLMPQQHMYMETHAQGGTAARPQQAPPASFDPQHPCPANITCKKLGTETINGRVCEKIEITTKSGTTTTWVDQKLLYPIKTVAASGYVTELSNIKEGKPDASLFEVPAGYKKMDMGTMGGGHPPH
jgi:outer membrane lipoprotein-sorting protein